MPIFGHTILSHNSAIFSQLGAIFHVRSGDHFLSKNQSFYASLSFLDYVGHFWRKILMVWGRHNRPKSWPTGLNFWTNHYLEIVSVAVQVWYRFSIQKKFILLTNHTITHHFTKFLGRLKCGIYPLNHHRLSWLVYLIHDCGCCDVRG